MKWYKTAAEGAIALWRQLFYFRRLCTIIAHSYVERIRASVRISATKNERSLILACPIKTLFYNLVLPKAFSIKACCLLNDISLKNQFMAKIGVVR
ncbi:hypothetical protein [Tolypothrix sp. NIES-4075]|uniref:hypothetical protein n=1 Tax=Tolypothrix sp. NIES-4075 TaxID=2005459 RepID=UPI00117D9081|nr:hypothetical protein [Tolypothrix sp. NIES-4075]